MRSTAGNVDDNIIESMVVTIVWDGWISSPKEDTDMGYN